MHPATELAREDDARSLIQELFRTEANMLVLGESNEPRIEVHSMSSARWNRAIAHLFTVLNATERCYPGTTLKLIYTLLSPKHSSP